MLIDAAAATQGPPPTPATATGGLQRGCPCVRVLLWHPILCPHGELMALISSRSSSGPLKLEKAPPQTAYTSKVRLPHLTHAWWLFSLKPGPVVHPHLLHQPRPFALLSLGTEPGSNSPPPLPPAPAGPCSFLRECTPALSCFSR